MTSRRLSAISCVFLALLSTAPSARAQHFAAGGSATASGVEATDLATAAMRQALLDERALIASHPDDPVNYVQLAYSLTDAGIGDEARDAALKATQVAPQSAFALSARAWVLHHNQIGVDYGKGMDYDGALACYRAAILLDPNDLAIRTSLANLLEFDKDGIRYASDAQLEEAIGTYRYVKAHQPVADPEVQDDLIIDLFYAGRFQEVLAELATVQKSPARDGIMIATLAAVRGVPAGVEFADHIGGDEQKKKDALNLAAEGLWNMRLYPQAAEILTASLPDTSDSKQLIGRINIFRNLRPYKGADLPSSDPRSPVQRILVNGLTNTMTEGAFTQSVSRHAFSSEAEWKRGFPEENTIEARLRTLSRQTGLPRVVLQDIVLNSLQITMVPSTGPGSQIVVRLLSVAAERFFVLEEDGSLKVVANDRDPGPIGTEALYLLHHQQQAEATALLNWKRDTVHSGLGDDPLGGSLFARLWTIGKSKGARDIEFAAASLMHDKAVPPTLLASVTSARAMAVSSNERDTLDLLLASLYLSMEDGRKAEVVSRELLRRHPESDTAVGLAGRSLGLTKQWGAWRSLLAEHVQRRPNDRELLLQSASAAEAGGDFGGARMSLRSIVHSGQATANDYNEYAWLSLFESNVDDDALEAAQQANLLSNESNLAYLHTLACLNASRGRTAEARQLLLQAMLLSGVEVPDSSAWYGFGRIYEQYGVRDAAVAAYRRVVKPEGVTSPAGVYFLAQLRLSALRGAVTMMRPAESRLDKPF